MKRNGLPLRSLTFFTFVILAAIGSEDAIAQTADDKELVETVALGDDWRYFDEGSRPADWNTREFDDRAWAQIGRWAAADRLPRLPTIWNEAGFPSLCDQDESRPSAPTGQMRLFQSNWMSRLLISAAMPAW
jgi:hypothetical protein